MKCFTCGKEYTAFNEDAGTHKESFCSLGCEADHEDIIEEAMMNDLKAKQSIPHQSQYQPNTGWITDFENDEETVEYCLCNDGNLSLSKRITLKPDGLNELHVEEHFVLDIKKETFHALYAAARKLGAMSDEAPHDPPR